MDGEIYVAETPINCAKDENDDGQTFFQMLLTTLHVKRRRNDMHDRRMWKTGQKQR